MELVETKLLAFPLGIAEGQYFCNREKETLQLVRNIQHSTHTLLSSPRRYGKTSLAYRAIKKCRHVNARIDLYMATSPSDIEKAILSGIDNVLHQISNNAELLINWMKDYVKLLRPSFEASSQGFKIKLQAIEKTHTAGNICEALQILDQVLQKKKIQGILLLDEFQEIQRVAPDHGIEGAIRHVAQETKNISIIFSGSHRHLLRSMFNDRNKPLYRLCDEIQLDRIDELHYVPFIQNFAREQWDNELSSDVIKAIFSKCERHPYYFNTICEKLFAKRSLPTEMDVENVWHDLTLIKRNDVLAETKELSIAHKKILVAISHGINHELTSQKFLSYSELPGSTVIRALEFLEENDFVEKKKNNYYLIDPLLKTIIKNLTYF